MVTVGISVECDVHRKRIRVPSWSALTLCILPTPAPRDGNEQPKVVHDENVTTPRCCAWHVFCATARRRKFTRKGLTRYGPHSNRHLDHLRRDRRLYRALSDAWPRLHGLDPDDRSRHRRFVRRRLPRADLLLWQCVAASALFGLDRLGA